MRDEAWNTEGHRNHWSSSAGSLRHGGMNFIAAGPMDPLVLVKSSSGSQEQELHVCKVEPVSTPTQEVNINVTTSDEIGIDKLEENTSIQVTAAEPAQGIPSVMNRSPTQRKKPSLALDLSSVAHVSPALPSPLLESSEEEIVFVPKKQRKVRSVSQDSVGLSREVSKVRLENSLPKVPISSWEDGLPSTGCAATVIEDFIDVTVTKSIPSVTVPMSKSMRRKEFKRAKNEKRARKYSQEMSDDMDDDVIADYIANTNSEELGNFITGAGSRDIGGKDMEFLLSESGDDSDDEYQSEGGSGDDDELDEPDFGVFDALSTSDECKGRVHRVLKKRHRPSGVQYLVKWEGSGTGDVSWVLAESLDSEARKLVKKFEKHGLFRLITEQNSEDSGFDDYSDNSDFDDDQLLHDKKAQEEADLKLARILAGLEDDHDSHHDLDDEAQEGDGDFNDFLVHKESGRMGMSIRPRNGEFPSATHMANAFSNEWDPMDWATPHNVIPKKNGKKGKAGKTAQWHFSDDELQTQLFSQWEKDRKVKKGRKAERELLRKEGLPGIGEKLGKNAKKAKHLDGVNMLQLHKEITDFLCNDFPYLALPPMSKAARKTIHNIAYVLNLVSQSRGTGKNRFPMLYKTSATSLYLGKRDLIAQQLTLVETRAVPFSKIPRKAPKALSEFSRVSPRDGDMVGGAAPEIGRENKGRMMLEKMGYKPGMALGVEGNKGITAPIIAVVKRTRTGLG